MDDLPAVVAGVGSAVSGIFMGRSSLGVSGASDLEKALPSASEPQLLPEAGGGHPLNEGASESKVHGIHAAGGLKSEEYMSCPSQ
mmetsp:Transcript_18437/g.40631  ORF Transcript_18437/g.40631 Transcript_18437/m.40631 type:complete len:85 (-) Transcript_18437:440-694(-)